MLSQNFFKQITEKSWKAAPCLIWNWFQEVYGVSNSDPMKANSQCSHNLCRPKVKTQISQWSSEPLDHPKEILLLQISPFLHAGVYVIPF